MRFTKMEGLGNDYIYFNCLEGVPPDLPALSARLSNRNFGVGGDGLICIKPGRGGDFSMEMYNADGSRGSMCGNGIRCLGKYVYDKGLTRKTCLTIDTDAGPRGLELLVRRGMVDRVRVNMGRAEVLPAILIQVGEEFFSVTQVQVGNPHGVIFCADPAAADLAQLGPVLEHHPALRERANIEFVSLTGEDSLSVRVWERGSGITLACGTGACACFAAARKEGLCGPRATVCLPGGALELEYIGEDIWMTGPARTVFEGEVDCS